MPNTFQSSASPVNTKKRLLIILAILAASRLLAAAVIWSVSGPSAFVAPDTGGYTDAALSLLHGSFATSGTPEIYRTPGYPVVLLLAEASGHTVLVALLENLLFALVSACLIWRITKDLFPSSRAAEWAVFLYCFEPLGFLFSEYVLTETLFCALLLSFVWLLLHFFRKPTYLNLVLAVIALSAASYTRPAALYLSIFLMPLFLLIPRKLPLWRRLANAVLFPMLFAATIVPWVLRNIAVADYAGFSTTPQWAMYFVSATAVTARVEHKSFAEVQREWGATDRSRYFRLHPEQRRWSQTQLAQYWGSESKRIISQHVMTYAYLHAQGCLLVLFDPEATDMLKLVRLYPKAGLLLLSRTLDEGPMRALLWVMRNYPATFAAFALLESALILYYLLALAGLKRVPPVERGVLVYLVLYFVLISGVPSAVGRYRAPIMPIVCIFASAAVAHWMSRKSDKASAAAQHD